MSMFCTIISNLLTEILGPVYDNEKENWRILTNKEICALENLL